MFCDCRLWDHGAVRLSCFLFFLSFFLSLSFCFFSSDFTLHDTCHHGTAHQRALCGTSRPLFLTLCLSLRTDGIWDGWLQKVPWWGTLVGRVAEPLPTLATERSHSAACGWVQARCAFFPFGKRKKTQWYLNICKAIFKFPFFNFFSSPTVFFVPLPRISVPLAVILWMSLDSDLSLSYQDAVAAALPSREGALTSKFEEQV